MRRSTVVFGVALTFAGCSLEDGVGRAAYAQEVPATHAEAPTPTAAKPLVHVWKTPQCGCCSAWVKLLEAAGYPVRVEDVTDLGAIKAAKGIPRAMAGCHTAEVDGYLVEGHVPVDAIDRMLAERPDLAGISVPGMPPRSPGMALPGQEEGDYEIHGFRRDGTSELIERR